MTEQTRAERLADELAVHAHHAMNGEAYKSAIDAAAELRRLSAVEQQRDELLKALKRAADHAYWPDIEQQARAAIAKVEGEV
jgi:hypothetical protein